MTKTDNPHIVFANMTTPDDPHFDEVYGLFASVFRSGGEPMVSADRFQQLLSFNTDEKMQAEWGPFSYTLTYAYNNAAKKVEGISFHLDMVMNEDVRALGTDAICLGEFICTNPESRGSGITQHLIKTREDFSVSIAQPFCRNHEPNLLVFNEEANHNVPLSYFLEDMETTGVHPCDRTIRTRRNAGYRNVDQRYQHYLIATNGGGNLDYYTLNVKGRGKQPSPDSLPSAVVDAFLRTNTAIIRNGANPDDYTPYLAAKEQLNALGTLYPTDDSGELHRLKPIIDHAVQYADRVLDAEVRISDLIKRNSSNYAMAI